MFKASSKVVEQVKQASIDHLVKLGHARDKAEILFDSLMDKLAAQMAMNVGGKRIGKLGVNTTTITPQGQKIRQLINGKGTVDSISNVKAANDNQLLLCKAAAICTGIKYGLSPLTSLLIFDQQLEKCADVLLKDAALLPLPSGQIPFNRQDQKTIDYLNEMRRTGLKNTQGIMGFNIQDPLSKARIKAVINGLDKGS